MPKINTLNLNSIDYEIEDATARESVSKLGKLPFIVITAIKAITITAKVSADTPSDTGKIPDGRLVGYQLGPGLTIKNEEGYRVEGLASQGVEYLLNVDTGHGDITGPHKGVAVYKSGGTLEIIC